MNNLITAAWIILAGFISWCSFDYGYKQGQNNPNIATIGFDNAEQYDQLTKRCKNMAEVQKMADIVIGIIKEER